jgi:PHD-finger
VACETCSVWQHSACHGIPQQEAEKEEFHFVCKACTFKAENPGATFVAQPVSKPAEPPKRKRGRPRKYPITEPVAKAPTPGRKKKVEPVDDLDDLGPPGSGVFSGVALPPSQASRPSLYQGPPLQPASGQTESGQTEHGFASSSPPPPTYDYYANDLVAPSSPVANHGSGAHFGSPTQTSKQANGYSTAAKAMLNSPSRVQTFASNGYPQRPSSGHGSQPFSTPHSSQHSFNSQHSHNGAQASSPNGQWGRPVPYTPSVTGLRAVSGQHSPPVPVLPSPRQPHGSPSTVFSASFGAGKPALTLSGSPPGYSPVKHDVPPSPPVGATMGHAQHHHNQGAAIHPPVVLDPDLPAQILTPPVKKATPSPGLLPAAAILSSPVAPAVVGQQNGSAGAGSGGAE